MRRAVCEGYRRARARATVRPRSRRSRRSRSAWRGWCGWRG